MKWQKLEPVIHKIEGFGHAFGALSIGITAAAGTALFFWEYLDTIDTLTLKFALTATTAALTAVSSLALFYRWRSVSKHYLLEGLLENNRVLKKNDESAVSYARLSAEFSHELHKIISDRNLPTASTEMAILTIDHFTERLLNHVARVFETNTGHKSAVCIKLIYGKQSAALRAVLHMRDTESRSTRSWHDNRRQLVRNNTALRTLFVPNDGFFTEDVYVCDNLDEALRNGEYHNDRPDWPANYNATIACAIQRLPSEAQNPFIGALCVDNKGGGLNSEWARQRLRQFSWQLSNLLHLRDRLALALTALSQNVAPVPLPSLPPPEDAASGDQSATGTSIG